MDNSEKLGVMIKKINITFVTEINNVLKKYDITKSQLDVLVYVQANQESGVTQRDIEKYFSISNPTVSGILDRLESKQLIERRISPKDARCKYIILTDKAIGLNKKWRTNLDRKERQLLSGLSDEEEKTLRSLLSKVLENISK